MSAPLRVAVLGSTGSIGLNTLDVLERHRDRYEVFALAARSNVARLREQCLQHRPRFAVVVDDSAAALLASQLRSAGSQTQVLAGEQALTEIAAHPDVDTIMPLNDKRGDTDTRWGDEVEGFQFSIGQAF